MFIFTCMGVLPEYMWVHMNVWCSQTPKERALDPLGLALQNQTWIL